MVKAASLGKTDADVTGRQSQKKEFSGTIWLSYNYPLLLLWNLLHPSLY
jgi:hypothetical protein